MISVHKDQPIDFFQRNGFQDSLDFFYERYLDFFPKTIVGS